MLDKEIMAMEIFAEQNGVPILEADSVKYIKNFIVKHQIKNILEIGTAIGYSAIQMATADPDVFITSIERDESRYLEALRNIKKCGLEKRITLILGDALAIHLADSFDLIFIDAAKGQYQKFFEHYENNLRSEGYIISDNIDFHGYVGNEGTCPSKNLEQLVKKIENYLEFLCSNPKYKTKFYKVGDGLAVSKHLASNEREY